MILFTAAAFLLPALQANATSDPFGAILDKYGLPGLCVFIMIVTLYRVNISQTKQVEARAEAEKLDKQRIQDAQTNYERLQNDVRLQLSQQNTEAKQREIDLHKEIHDLSQQLAALQVKVAVHEEQAKNYDDRIAYLKLQLQVKQSDFDQQANERKVLEQEVAKLRNELDVLNQAYQSLREQHDLLVLESNVVKTQVGQIKRDTQTVIAVQPNLS